MPRTTVIKTISLEPATLQKGMRSARRRGFKKNFSGLVSKLIEDDDARLKNQAPVRAREAVGA